MSSRLLTMKVQFHISAYMLLLIHLQFMQRAAGAGTSQSSNLVDQRPSKRARVSRDTAGASTIVTSSDFDSVQAALAAEELKRKQALEKQAHAAGETRWVLDFQNPAAGHAETRPGSLLVVSRGFAELDKEDEEEDEDAETKTNVNGRRFFGDKCSRLDVEESIDGTSTNSSDASDKEESEIEYDPNDPAAALITEVRRKAEKKDVRVDRKLKKLQRNDTAKRAAINRHKGAKLEQLNSISSTRGRGNGLSGKEFVRGKRNISSDMQCFRCGNLGHQKRDCTN